MEDSLKLLSFVGDRSVELSDSDGVIEAVWEREVEIVHVELAVRLPLVRVTVLLLVFPFETLLLTDKVGIGALVSVAPRVAVIFD